MTSKHLFFSGGFGCVRFWPISCVTVRFCGGWRHVTWLIVVTSHYIRDSATWRREYTLGSCGRIQAIKLLFSFWHLMVGCLQSLHELVLMSCCSSDKDISQNDVTWFWSVQRGHKQQKFEHANETITAHIMFWCRRIILTFRRISNIWGFSNITFATGANENVHLEFTKNKCFSATFCSKVGREVGLSLKYYWKQNRWRKSAVCPVPT